MKRRATALKYWVEDTTSYMDADPRRRFIAGIVAKYARPEDLILELGCNTGSNLIALKSLGFSIFAGVDINKAAIATAEKRLEGCDFRAFPGDIADEIENIIQAGGAEVVFTMAALMHIHPDSVRELKRLHEVAKRMLIICEWEGDGSFYIIQRNYWQLFRKKFRQIHCVDNLDVEGINGYTLRVFINREAE